MRPIDAWCGTLATLGFMQGDGNGWAAGPQGARLWGRYGAAGLFLLTAPARPRVLLQHRARWTNQGGTWALPGGARDSHESASAAAIREAAEETGLHAEQFHLVKEVRTAGPFAADPQHPELAGGWTYTTVIGRTVSGGVLDTTANEESLELRWAELEEIPGMPLMPAFARSLPGLFETVGKALPEYQEALAAVPRSLR